MKSIILSPIFVLLISICAFAQTTEFTYQGSLNIGPPPGTPANTPHDFEFRLFSAESGGSQLGSALSRPAVSVSNGIFSVRLDFGNQFQGVPRWLEIKVKPAGGPSFTTLAPRQKVSPVPESIFSLNADTALNTNMLGGVAANQYVRTNDFRLSDARPPLPNSGNYIQNNPASQQSGNFNISGDGTMGGILSARLNAVVTGSSGTAIQAQNLNAGSNQNLAVSGTSVSGPPGFGTGGRFEGGAFGVQGIGNGGTTTASTAGVYGLATGSAGSRTGVAGVSDGSPGVASGSGVFGNAIGAAVNYGVYGSASGGTTNWAGYFDGNTHVGGNLGIGTLTPASPLHLRGSSNNFALTFTNQANTGGRRGYRIAFDNDRLSFQKADDAGVFIENQVTIDQATGAVSIGREAVGGNLTVYGNTLVNTITVANGVTLNVLGSAGGTQLCRNLSNQISNCSSSLRYKTNIAPFSSGLSFINQLRPITFDWKAGGMRDVGLGAEDVAKIDPLLVTYNEKGEVEGVKYDRIGVVLINAVKEQQTEIKALEEKMRSQEETIGEQKLQIDAIKKALCEMNPGAKFCKP